jgi:1-acyl-sn-glycerol-3-phosphate acyltransferase
MNWLRSVLFLLGATLITVPAGILLAIGAFLLPLKLRFQIVHTWRAAFIALERYVLCIKTEVIGRENIPDHPSVVMCKHQSAWETVALQELFKPGVFVLKRELLLIPFFGWGLASIRMISIDRKAGKEALRQVVEQGKNRLKQGIWVIIFPEGTRMAPGEHRPFQIGGAFLAAKAGATVVPVAHNAGEIWAKNAFVKRAGTVTISIGPAFDTTGMSVQAVNQRAEAWIEAEMRKLSPHRYPDHGTDTRESA